MAHLYTVASKPGGALPSLRHLFTEVQAGLLHAAGHLPKNAHPCARPVLGEGKPVAVRNLPRWWRLPCNRPTDQQ